MRAHYCFQTRFLEQCTAIVSLVVEDGRGSGPLTAIEHALRDDWSANPARPGILDTSTPLSSSASVTLKSVGSKLLPSATVARALIAKSLMVAFAVGSGCEGDASSGRPARCTIRYVQLK